jgi:hypothetical protein
MERGTVENRIGRTLALIVATLLLLTACLSFLYIGLEAGHHCEDEDCSVCCCIRMCEGLIRKIGSGISTVSATALFILITIIAKSVMISNNPVETLVSRKIRLND